MIAFEYVEGGGKVGDTISRPSAVPATLNLREFDSVFTPRNMLVSRIALHQKDQRDIHRRTFTHVYEE